jgi:hypothetical protein
MSELGAVSLASGSAAVAVTEDMASMSMLTKVRMTAALRANRRGAALEDVVVEEFLIERIPAYRRCARHLDHRE